jgi:hypothetical protein
MRHLTLSLALCAGVAFSGCATAPAPKDYSEFDRRQPRSILVLPPINESTEVRATYSFYTTTIRPLAELGYYVFPLVIVDQFMKENGLPGPEEMHQVSLEKLHEAFGADTVLYITIEKFGSKYQVIASNTIVYSRAKLVDCRSGTVLWEERVQTIVSGQAGFIEAAVEQVLNSLTDRPHSAAQVASHQLLTPTGKGLPKGPRHPEYTKP